MSPEQYLRRVNRLRDRGLSDALWRDLRQAGDVGLLREVEQCSDAGLRRLNELDRQRREAADPCPRCGRPKDEAVPTYVTQTRRCQHR
jgi:hypothetical protein